MTELVIDDRQKFVPAKVAADRVGYSSDYVTRLAREGKVLAKRDGRQWFVDLDSVKLFTLEVEAEKRRKQQNIKEERRLEQLASRYPKIEDELKRRENQLHQRAVLETVAVCMCLFLIFSFGSVVRTNHISSDSLVAGVSHIEGQMQAALSFGSVKDVIDAWWWFVREDEVVITDWISKPVEADMTVSPDGKAVRQPPQVEVDTGVIVIAEKDDGLEEPSGEVAASFSDNTLVEFADTKTGTITPVFRTGHGDDYPFRLVPEPQAK